MSSEVQKDPTPNAKAKANANAEGSQGSQGSDEPVVELGDKILIEGGVLDKDHGRVYYRDGSMIKIMVDGSSHMLIEIPLDEEGEPSAELGIQNIAILEKRKLPAFTQQEDLQKDQFVRTFTKDGKAGPTFVIRAVDTGNDRAVFEDETGATLDLDFGFIGIPLNESFSVIRTGPPPQAPAAEEGELTFDQAAEVEVQQEPLEPLFKILGKIEVPAIPQIYERPPVERIYPDVIQRADMIQDLLRLKDVAQQKNPRTLVEIRKLVELCILLRNELVDYAPGGMPSPIPKETSVSELIHLLESGLPLARPVLNAIRTIYIDSRETDEPKKAGVRAELLADVVKSSLAFLETPFAQDTQRAAWVLTWQGYVDRYFRPWTPTGTDSTTFQNDTDFFRLAVPDPDINDVPGLVPTYLNDKVALKLDYVGKVPFSMLRGLGPRKGRPTTRGPEIVNSAEEAPILNYILFPFNFMRSLGPTRSGSLLLDSMRSQQPMMRMAEILAEKNGVSEFPTADSIIAVGPDGSTLGNIELHEYLKRVPLKGIKGFGDFEDLFKAMGLNHYELNEDQLKTLAALIVDANAMTKESLRILRSRLAAVPQVTERPFGADGGLLERFQSQPDLQKAIATLKSLTPIYERVDLAVLAFLHRTYQDFTEAVIGGKAIPIARERIRAVRDAFQESLRITYLAEKRKENAGLPPVPNTCVHVGTWAKIQKVKDTTDRMRLTTQFVTRFKGRENDELTHFECVVCKQNLMCKHEFLLLQEFLHPQESQVLHKELLLNYSGGQFQGHYICKICGQPISDIDFDTSLEYDDNGRPMMGRAVLVDEDAVNQEEYEELFGAPTTDENELDFQILVDAEGYKFRDSLLCGAAQAKPTTVAECIYAVARQLYGRLGVEAEGGSLIWLVQSVHSEIMKLADRDTYMRQQAAQAKKLGTTKGATDYDVYINRRLVGLTANYVLIDIQTKTPDYLVRSTLPGCRATFKGWPRGKKENDGLAAIEYLSCAVGSVTKDAAPWNMTGWLKERQDKKRQTLIMKYLEQVMEKIMEDATIQQLYVTKENYTREVLGESESGGAQEKIPAGFLPVMSGASIIEGSASPAVKVGAWIQKIHETAKAHTQLIENSPYTETTCCFTDIKEPSRFWKEKGFLTDGRVAPLGSRGSRLLLHYTTRPLAILRASAPEELYSRVFLNVCFRGARKGLPHEVNLTGRCPWCDFQFPADPADPTFTDLAGFVKEKQKLVEDARENALTEQGIVINKESFQDVLDASHVQYKLPALATAPRIDQLAFFRMIRDMAAPYDDWVATIQASLAKVEALPPGADLPAQAEAWNALVQRTAAHEAALKSRVGEPTIVILKGICGLSPIEVKSQLTTYFIVPFRRGINGLGTEHLQTVLTDYKLSTQHKADITGFLKEHLKIQAEFNGAFTTPLLKARAEELVTRLAAIVKLLTNLRMELIRIGGPRIVEFIMRSMILGAFSEYADLNRVPVGTVGSGEDSVASIRKSLAVVSECAARYQREAKKYSDVELRDALTKRAEKEKLDFINRIKDKTPELKQIEKLKKQLGLGDWAVGGTKGIYAYDADRYDYEREERARAGIVDFPGYGPEGAPAPAGREVDAFGFAAGGDGDGYNAAQPDDDEEGGEY